MKSCTSLVDSRATLGNSNVLMKSALKRFTIGIAAALIGCAGSPTERPETSFVVSTGTFFGFCGGYCYTELVLDGNTVRFTETSRDSARLPPRTRSLELEAADAERIRALVDPAVLSSLAGVHGCPDCADGGGEWVQVRSPDDSTRVTFEHGRVLNPIAELQAELRALRNRFPATRDAP